VRSGSAATTNGCHLCRRRGSRRRSGGFHPANPLLAHEFIGKMALGIDIAEQPRWG
jgi:hypothetical protein